MNNTRFIPLLLLLSGVLFYQQLSAQGETNIWYFGNKAGIDFNSGSPVLLTNSQMAAFEGSATISDAAGNLLLYSDGQTVWNSSHVVLTNGTGLGGSIAAAQNSLFIPKPGSATRCYLFTNDQQGSFNGLMYSEIDVASGVVVTKNTPLLTPATEHLTASKDCNGSDFWVVAHQDVTDTFCIYKVTAAGVNPVPVKTKIGPAFGVVSGLTYARFSPDGTKLAIVYGPPSPPSQISIFDFDRTTGILSNELVLDINASYPYPYGLEFSSDGSKIYTTIQTMQKVLQWDLSAGSVAAINATLTEVGTTASTDASALLRGPDNKIYVARFGMNNTHLGVINNPNVAGVGCGYVDNGFALAPKTSEAGLPNFALFNPVSFATFITSTSQAPTSCFAGSDGTATVNLPAGPTYTYLWDDGQTTQTATGLSPGTHSVTVNNSNICAIDTASVVVGQAAFFDGGVNTQTHNNCFGDSTGTIVVAAAGGTSPYSYSWDNGLTGDSIVGLPAGYYAVVATDNNGCTFSIDSLTVNQPLAPLTVDSSKTINITCNGNNNGQALVYISGGTTSYTYSWIGTSQTASTVTGLTPGGYTVNITDSKGCNTNQTFMVNEPTTLNFTSVDTTHVTCNGLSTGSAVVTPGGGTAPYSYSWSNGDLDSVLTAVGFGSYTVTVTDANGCTKVHPYTITQPTALSAIKNTTDVGCKGDSTGAMVVTPSGGTQPYLYSWTTNPVETDSAVANVVAGSYTVLVTDANNCQLQQNFTVAEPAAELSVSVTPTHVLCYGDSTGVLTAVAAGGNTVYTYSWSNGSTISSASGLIIGSYTLQVNDNKGCSLDTTLSITQPASPVSATEDSTNVTCFGLNDGTITITPMGGNNSSYSYVWNPNVGNTTSVDSLSQGTYTVIVSDANACSVVKTIQITMPTALTLTADKIDVLCKGGQGSASAIVGGGSPNYSYSWTGGQTNATATGLLPATYTVVVTDIMGCTKQQSVVVTEPSDSLKVSAVNTDVLCKNGSNGTANVSAVGGTPNYNFSWSTGATTSSIINLPAAGYTVMATDANGCTSLTVVTINEPATALNATTSGSYIACYGNNTGSAMVSGSNGTGPYTYSWIQIGDSTNLVSGLTAGTYSVMITDANGCTLITTSEVSQPSVPLRADFSFTPESGSYPLTVTFNNQSTGSNSYYWNFGDSSAVSFNSDPSHIYDTTGIYTIMLVVQSDSACADTIYKTLEVHEPYTIVVPNIFTPNGDGINDVFEVRIAGAEKLGVQIYDRWGLLMTSWNDLIGQWDGKTQSGNSATDGVYYYVLTVADLEGKEYIYKGFFSLVR